MTEEERQEEGIEPEAAHAPPVTGDPEENPEQLEEHLEESWDHPADEDKSPTETAEALEAEAEAFEPPEEEVETEREAVEEAVEESSTSVVDESEAIGLAEDEAQAAEVEADQADELSQMLAEAGEIVEESQATADTELELEPEEATVEEVEEPAPEEPEVEVTADLEEMVEAIIESDEAEEEVEEEDDDRHWYVIHCYSGQENKVRHNLEQRIETMGMKDKIFDVVVPTEEEIEVKDGKRRTVERRVFPGYILVQMVITEESWYVVRNTPGVTGFVGMGNEPTPLRPEEVSSIIKRMEAEAPRIKVTYKLGQKVRIIDGPFNDFIGTVDDIDMDRAKVRVMVSFFGRETPVELDFLQVEKA